MECGAEIGWGREKFRANDAKDAKGGSAYREMDIALYDGRVILNRRIIRTANAEEI
jgi:hypothetical protein